MDKPVTLFEYFDHMTVKKTKWTDDPMFTKNYSQYMINRFIGMHDMFISIINDINKMGQIPDEIHYNFLKMILPKKKMYFKYISKHKINKKDQANINNIMAFFEISETEALEYLQFIPAKGLTDINTFLNGGGKR